MPTPHDRIWKSKLKWLCTVLFGLWLFITPASQADSITLLDGAVIEGVILEETDSTVTINAEFAGGTIFQKRTIDRSKIKSITRLSEEEIKQRDMEKEFAQLARLQLNPQTSLPSAEYDRVINQMFKPFLAKYPDSPRAQEVNERLAQWEFERQQIEVGMAKLDGQWIPRDQALQQTAAQRVQAAFKQADAAMLRQDFPSAIQQMQAIAQLTQDANLVQEAKKKTVAIYTAWLSQLTQRRSQLENEIRQTEADIQRFQSQRDNAQAQMNQSSGLRNEPTPPQPADRGSVYYNAKQRARSVTTQPGAPTSPTPQPQPEQSPIRMSSSINAQSANQMAQAIQKLAELNPRLTALNRELQAVKTTELRAQTFIQANATVPQPQPDRSQAAAAPVPASPPTTAMTELLNTAKEHWILVVAGILVLMGLITMFTRRTA